jgi:hypothetical protein
MLVLGAQFGFLSGAQKVAAERDHPHAFPAKPLPAWRVARAPIQNVAHGAPWVAFELGLGRAWGLIAHDST